MTLVLLLFSFRSQLYFGFSTVFPTVGSFLLVSGVFFKYGLKLDAVIICCLTLSVILVTGFVNDVIPIILVIKFVLPFLTYFATRQWLRLHMYNLENLSTWVSRLLWFVILYLVVECLFRFVLTLFFGSDWHPPGSVREFLEGDFYLFKVMSPFFFDSNVTAIFCLLFWFLAFSFQRYIAQWKLAIFHFVFFALTLLTFSRAAIAFAIFFILFRYKKIIFIPLVLALFLIDFNDVVSYLKHDFTFGFKVEAWLQLFDFKRYSLDKFLFGFGYPLGYYAYSPDPLLSSHTLIPVLMGFVGLIGTLTYYAVFIFIVSDLGKLSLFFFLAFNVVGFSVIDPFEPVIFFILALVAHLRVIEVRRRNLLKATA